MLTNVVGQDRAKQALKLLTHGYKRRKFMPPVGIFGGSGLGKCFARGTKIRMYNGSVKNVEDIQNGEYVMGDDSTPRLVYGTTSGREEMYEIRPRKGKPWRVNTSHILVLVDTKTNKIVEMPVRDYLTKPLTWQRRQKLYRVPVEYDRYPVKIDPYFMGLWLGDGDWNRPYITSADREIHEYLKHFATTIGMTTTHRHPNNRCDVIAIRHIKRQFNDRGRLISTLKNDFLSYGLMQLQEKFIPSEYLINDRVSRLQLLAGLIDSDGSYHGGVFEITSRWFNLAGQTQELALSLGFWASLTPKVVNETTYYRVIISGHLDDIPTIIPRKRAEPRRQIKNVRRTGFTIKACGEGVYYGFAVDKNNRFLLDDFTVTHNTHLVNAWAGEIGAKCIYVNGTAVKDALAFRGFFREAAEDSSNYYLVFIDECHGLPRKVQDNLLSVLEQPAILCTVAPKDMGVVRCVDGRRYIEKGDVVREELPDNMSFVLATTDPARLKDPILNRLRKIQLTPYSIDDKIKIAMTHLGDQGVKTEEVIYKALANRCRSIRHLKSELCETFMDITTLYRENETESLHALDDMLGIDQDGATDQDMDYLEYLVENPTVGLDTMAGKLGIDKQEVSKHIEPFLLEKGWICITGRGRKLTNAGFKKVLGDDFTVSDE